MDLITIDADGQVIGTVSSASFISISEMYDFINDKYRYNIKVTYSENNWKLLRDSNLIFDNEVPEAPIKVDEIKVEGVQIVIKGHSTSEQLIN